jgi:hypothetical protein
VLNRLAARFEEKKLLPNEIVGFVGLNLLFMII